MVFTAYKGGYGMVCDRCHKETSVSKMSWFNLDRLCLECQDEESKHPRFELARATEEAAVAQGNYNFPGIGWDKGVA